MECRCGRPLLDTIFSGKYHEISLNGTILSLAWCIGATPLEKIYKNLSIMVYQRRRSVYVLYVVCSVCGICSVYIPVLYMVYVLYLITFCIIQHYIIPFKFIILLYIRYGYRLFPYILSA